MTILDLTLDKIDFLLLQFVVFEFSDLYVHGYRLKRNEKFIPLIDCSELITFELRKLSALEVTYRDFSTEGINFIAIFDTKPLV